MSSPSSTSHVALILSKENHSQSSPLSPASVDFLLARENCSVRIWGGGPQVLSYNLERWLCNYVNLGLQWLRYFILSRAKPISKFQPHYVSLLDIFQVVWLTHAKVVLRSFEFSAFVAVLSNWSPIHWVRMTVNFTLSLFDSSLASYPRLLPLDCTSWVF